ncbi:MAG: NAD(P)H-dependent glycerol-3-phosphate dehydrogenase [Gammaproteobacteria bacterium]
MTVLGAGSWGTALAIQLARSGPARLWGRDAGRLAAMAAARENAEYLPGARFPDSLQIEPDLAAALDGVNDLLVVVPSHAFRETLWRAAPHLRPGMRVAYAAKGFEPGSGKLPQEVVAEVLGADIAQAVVSGPTFAKEVAAGMPGAIVVASTNAAFSSSLVDALHHGHFRAYRSDDVVGVEVGGAVKNVVAVATGMSDGLGFGANARAALITRGLAEMVRLGTVLGGRHETFLGLAGVGDLVLTCTDDQSRNRRLGLALGRGEALADAQQEIRQVVEGVVAAREVMRLAQQHGIEMPISEQVHEVLYEGVTATAAFETLMARDPRVE